AFNSETLTKYINTLRFLGCDIPRLSSRTDHGYVLAQHPFPLRVDDRPLALAGQLLSLLEHRADNRLAAADRDFCKRLCWIAGREPFAVFSRRDGDGGESNVIDLVEHQRCLMERYSGYCRDGQMLHVRLGAAVTEMAEVAEMVEMIIEPTRVVQEGKR